MIFPSKITEKISLDISVGDVVLGGKFKNKRITVKSISKNDKGDITINGKPLLKFRILQEMKSFKEYLEEESADQANTTGDAVAKPDSKLGDKVIKRKDDEDEKS